MQTRINNKKLKKKIKIIRIEIKLQKKLIIITIKD